MQSPQTIKTKPYQQFTNHRQIRQVSRTCIMNLKHFVTVWMLHSTKVLTRMRSAISEPPWVKYLRLSQKLRLVNQPNNLGTFRI